MAFDQYKEATWTRMGRAKTLLDLRRNEDMRGQPDHYARFMASMREFDADGRPTDGAKTVIHCGLDQDVDQYDLNHPAVRIWLLHATQHLLNLPMIHRVLQRRANDPFEVTKKKSPKERR